MTKCKLADKKDPTRLSNCCTRICLWNPQLKISSHRRKKNSWITGPKDRRLTLLPASRVICKSLVRALMAKSTKHGSNHLRLSHSNKTNQKLTMSRLSSTKHSSDWSCISSKMASRSHHWERSSFWKSSAMWTSSIWRTSSSSPSQIVVRKRVDHGGRTWSTWSLSMCHTTWWASLMLSHDGMFPSLSACWSSCLKALHTCMTWATIIVTWRAQTFSSVLMAKWNLAILAWLSSLIRECPSILLQAWSLDGIVLLNFFSMTKRTQAKLTFGLSAASGSKSWLMATVLFVVVMTTKHCPWSRDAASFQATLSGPSWKDFWWEAKEQTSTCTRALTSQCLSALS